MPEALTLVDSEVSKLVNNILPDADPPAIAHSARQLGSPTLLTSICFVVMY